MSLRRPTGGMRGSVLVPSVCAGLLLALSLPPWGWWPLAFCGAALLYRRLRGLRLRTRVLAGWAAGLGCFVPGLWWAASFNWYGAVVLMAVEALSTAVAAALVPADRWRVPAFAGAFTLLEAVRLSWPFGGLPLGGVFLGQATGPLLPAARLGGPLLLTAVVWLGGAGLAELVDGVRARRLRAVAAGALAGALVAAAGAVGAVAPDGGPAVRTLLVAAVQGGGKRGTLESEVDPATVFAAQVAATDSLLSAERRRRPTQASPQDGSARARPTLVVWPEDVVAVGPHLAGTPQAAVVATLARQLGATLVAGVTETLSATAFRNEAVVWAPSGRVIGTYEKVHRVPFGEYVPDRALFSHLADLSAVPRDAVPGHGTGSLRTPAARIGLMVSYEVFFASRARSSVRAGAELLVVPTNTSSYASSQVPTLEIAADRMQAVSEGRDLVQAAPTGYSAVVTHLGTVVRRSPLGARGVVTATVGLRTGRTLYEELGDLPVLAAGAAALALPLARRAQAEAEARRRRRHGWRWRS